MTQRVTHLNPAGLHRNPAFTQAVVVEGGPRTVYIGGQNAVAADGRVVGEGDLAAQTEQVRRNLEALLAAAGATVEDVITWTIAVVQGEDLRSAFEVFQRTWGTTPNPPAISVLIVAGLANPAFLIEVGGVAVTGTRAAGDG